MSTAKEKGKAKVQPGNEVIHSSGGYSSDEHSSDEHHSDEKETKGKVGGLSKGMSTAKEKGKAKVEPGNEVIHSSAGYSSDEHSFDEHHSDEKETKGKVGGLSKGMSTAKEKGKAKVEPGNEVIHSSNGYSSDEHSSSDGHHSDEKETKGKVAGLEQIDFQKYNSEITICQKVRYFRQDFRYLSDVFKKNGDERFDRRALAALAPYRELVNGAKAIDGLVPGVKTGAAFHYRAEITLTGLHRPNQAGKDFMSVNAQEYRDNAGLANCSIVRNNVSIAVSVVVADLADHSIHGNYVRLNWMNYEGQGKDLCDQKASGGNLALIHSCHLNLFVRVVRRYEDGRFVYDGLFDVKGYKYYVKKNSRPEFRVHI